MENKIYNNNTALTITLVIIAFFFVTGFGMMSFWGFGGMGGMMNWMFDSTYIFWPTMLFMIIIWILVIIILILEIVWLTKQIERGKK